MVHAREAQLMIETPKTIAVSMRSGNIYRVAEGNVQFEREVDGNDISFRDYHYYHTGNGYRFYVQKSIAHYYGIRV